MPKKVNLNSVADLRTATDDALPELFQQLGYEQSFSLTDLRLGLGLVTVAIAGGLYYLEKKVPFKDSYYIIMASIAVYSVVSLAMYYLANGARFKDNKYIGINGQKQKVSVYTQASAFHPVYEVKLVINDNFSGAIRESIPFNTLYDGFGYLNESEAKRVLQGLLNKKAQ